MSDFTQVIVFMGISQSDDKSKFIVAAKIVTYSTIEDAEFVIYDTKLANIFRKLVKPYTAISVYGHIKVIPNTDDVNADDDCWGEKNEMTRQFAPVVRELVITGATPSTMDTTLYTQDAMEKAMAKIAASKQAESDYGSSNNAALSDDDTWGESKTSNSVNDDLDEDVPW
jgi:hypothetical protein